MLANVAVAFAMHACSVSKVGADVRVTFIASDAPDVCRKLARQWSGNGDYWTTRPIAPSDRRFRVCFLGLPNGATVKVQDSGSAYIGVTVCGNLVHAGWREIPFGE